jgi:hypothetical protein
LCGSVAPLASMHRFAAIKGLISEPPAGSANIASALLRLTFGLEDAGAVAAQVSLADLPSGHRSC